MRVVIQRTSGASVCVDGEVIAQIQAGLLVLAGFEHNDTPEDLAWISGKICNLRIFDDAAGVMNLSVKDTEGAILLVSQFTLYADTRKGNRPSWIRAAKPDAAIPLYEELIRQLEHDLAKKIQTGRFGADMKITLVNDGPVTILIDSKNRE
jgi:D-aminoacyl-tRNA deacylase